jgi:glycosyltransferase involved in cell wall biosynthesis
VKKGILFVTGGFYPELHGGSIQIRNLIRNLKKKYNIFVLSSSKIYNTSLFDIANKSNIFRLKKNNFFLSIYNILKMILFFLLIQKKISIIHFRGFTKKVILIIILGKIFRKKIIYSPTRYLEDDIYTLKKNIFFYYFIRKIDVLLCISKIFFTGKNAFVKKIFKFEYLPNFVDLNIYRFKKKKFHKNLNILFIGFFSKIKNPQLIYNAWKKIKNKNIKIIFIGKKNFDYYLSDFRIYNQIYDDAKKNSLLKKIKFVDQTNKITKYFNISDIFVLPSKTEGMPNSLLEAMASGLVPVVLKISNLYSDIIIDKFNGFILKKNNANELAKILQNIIYNKNKLTQISINARKTIEKKFDLNIYLVKIKNVYKNLC